MADKKTEVWKAAYYPREIIENQRTRTILCLLFDTIVCHFPVQAPFTCGGGSGISDLFSDDVLVKAGIIELEEENVLHGVQAATFDNYVDLQVTGMALQKCNQGSLVPVTDNPDFQIPAFVLTKSDILRNAELQAASVAISSIDLVLPPIGGINDEDILQLRDELSNELVPFRRSMLRLAPLIRQHMDEGAGIKELYDEARYLTQTTIIPSLGDLRDRIEKESGAFWRRILLRSGAIIPRFIINWTQKDIVSAAVGSLGDLSELAGLGIDRQRLIDNILREGGIGFLLSLERHPAVR